MGLRGLLRLSSDGLRPLRPRAAGNGLNILVTGSSSNGVESVERSKFSSMGGLCFLDYVRNFSSTYIRSASSNSQVSKLSRAFISAPLSSLSSSGARLLPTSARSFAEPRVMGDGLLVQQLNASSWQRQQKRGVSKLKKYKIKPYSSYKERFKLMTDGTYKRWRSGTRHNAHSKTAKQRRQLRQPSIAPLALAKVMKKLNFMG